MVPSVVKSTTCRLDVVKLALTRLRLPFERGSGRFFGTRLTETSKKCRGCVEEGCTTRLGMPPPPQHSDHPVHCRQNTTQLITNCRKYEYAKSLEDEENSELKTGEPRTSTSHIPGLSEKMRMDLDAVTSAIDRLYLVAPQLHNQRVELKQRKVEELERAKHALPRSAEGKGKGKDRDAQELDTLLGMIGKASARRMNDQAVVVSEEMRMRMELAQQKDAVKVTIVLSCHK
jgi:hypothetical protein